ncbi:MAG: peptidase M10 [Gloeobacteraceae cyanobacterium ES-bin-316]|nr:peptidase M10 [Ferruginibacter sp.]
MGIAELDNINFVLTIRASMVLYGDAATGVLSRQVAADIQDHWNKPAARVIVKNISYRVLFSIAGVYQPALRPQEVFENDDPSYNFFRVEEYADHDISFVDGIGSNTGYFKLDNLRHSSTAAHEFGHGLGLEHPVMLDIRGGGAPGIMYPRGTITDPHFQYDPAAAPFTNGGTLNPIHRNVFQKDVDDLRLPALFSSRNRSAIVGAFSSVWHEKHLPV